MSVIPAPSHPTSVAVVMTCHNRRERTQASIESIRRSARHLPRGYSVHIIVVDDGSTDGTHQLLQSLRPHLSILRGDGQLFWNGGMRRAFGLALEQNHDFYLWLNDDVVLFETAMPQMLETHDALIKKYGNGGIVVGSTCDDRGQITYGGRRRRSKLNPLWLSFVYSTDQALSCETFNGNCVLISANAAETLGNLDPAFVHNMGDLDYGFRALKKGVPQWVMPGFVGRCVIGPRVDQSGRDPSIPFVERWQRIISAKALPPRAWAIFCKRHAGYLWPAIWTWTYLKVVIRLFY